MLLRVQVRKMHREAEYALRKRTEALEREEREKAGILVDVEAEKVGRDG